MFKWKITLILRNGDTIKGISETDKDNSLKVAEELFPEDKPNCISGIKSEDETETLFFRVQEVAAFKIGL